MPADVTASIELSYFVSYAHDDDRPNRNLLKRLEVRLAIAKGYRVQSWDDRRLLVGEEWFAGIMEAIAKCDFGLLLLSPAFFASPFIRNHELPRLLAEKRLIPVALRPLPLDGSADLAGVEALQIFPYPFGKPFSERRSDSEKDRFADELYGQIIQVMRRDVLPQRP